MMSISQTKNFLLIIFTCICVIGTLAFFEPSEMNTNEPSENGNFFTTLQVTSNADSGAGSLREVVSNANPGDTITFVGQMTIQLSSGHIPITKDLTIIGNGPDSTIIDTTSGFGNNTLFSISGMSYVEIREMTFQNGGGDPATTGVWGGAIFFDGAALFIYHCYFSKNNAFLGGAIRIQEGSLLMERSVFENNTSQILGGAINTRGTDLKTHSAYNCLFHHNTSGTFGGAINNENSQWVLLNNTFVDNRAVTDDGGAFRGNIYDIHNNIFYENSAGGVGNNISGTNSMNGNNLLSDFSGSGMLAGENGNIAGDPMFIDTANHDYRLMPSSPCIDIGHELVIWSTDFLDLAGNPRTFGPEEDLGAYESSANSAGGVCQTTLFAPNLESSGNMFTIINESTKSIWIDSFYVNLATGTWDLEVYYTTTAPSHTGHEMDAGAWTLLGSATVTSNGINVPTLLPIGGLVLNGGQSKGIYITTKTASNGMAYSNGAATEIISDGILAIDLVNNPTGNQYPFSSVFTPRRWNGTICYHIADACPYDRLMPFDPVLTGIYKAENTILSTGRVATNSLVSYSAALSTTLDEGFEVEQGATFFVETDGCTNNVVPIVNPLTPIYVCGTPNSPPNEEFEKIIDGDTLTKFYNSLSNDSLAFVVDIVVPEIVRSMDVTRANDVPERDPMYFEIRGSFDDIVYSEIARGNIPCIPDRFETRNFPFFNETPYRYYKIIFKNECTVFLGLQLAEVQLYAEAP